MGSGGRTRRAGTLDQGTAGDGRPSPRPPSPPSPTLGFARAGGTPTDRHVYAPHAHDEFTVGVTAGALLLDEDLTFGIGVAFTLILAGSVLATAAAGPAREVRRVSWSTRQTSRAGGRVESLTGLPEERPGSTGQGDG